MGAVFESESASAQDGQMLRGTADCATDHMTLHALCAPFLSSLVPVQAVEPLRAVAIDIVTCAHAKSVDARAMPTAKVEVPAVASTVDPAAN